MAQSAYGAAGVDLEAKSRVIQLMRDAVRSTYGPEVLWCIGAFGGLYDASRLREMRSAVLVGSVDGVGTKTMVAAAVGSYETLGQDIVNHCVNYILVQGAEPLFFLDYVAMAVLKPELVARLVSGIAAACREAGCAILGGETAEMPDVYAPGELDLAGTIIGVVEREGVIDGSTISAGDVLIGLPSSGLHTNGFSLVRRLFAGEEYARHQPELGCTLGEALVEPHRSYLPHVRAMRAAGFVKGLAHITGGGFVDNIPRILPEGLGAVIDRSAWPVPPLFALIARRGAVGRDEMYRVFNMGIGMVAVVSPREVQQVLAAVPDGAWVIGEVISHATDPRVVLK